MVTLTTDDAIWLLVFCRLSKWNAYGYEVVMTCCINLGSNVGRVFRWMEV